MNVTSFLLFNLMYVTYVSLRNEKTFIFCTQKKRMKTACAVMSDSNRLFLMSQPKMFTKPRYCLWVEVWIGECNVLISALNWSNFEPYSIIMGSPSKLLESLLFLFLYLSNEHFNDSIFFNKNKTEYSNIFVEVIGLNKYYAKHITSDKSILDKNIYFYYLFYLQCNWAPKYFILGDNIVLFIFAV